jgi:hypothetical protein
LLTASTLALLLALALAWPGRSSAATAADQRQAMECWKRGLEHFGKGNYREAMREFTRGHALSGKAGFLFNMAECARLMNDARQARTLYLRYLAEHPQGKLRAEAQRRCQELGAGACVAPPAAAGAPRAAPAVDGEDSGLPAAPSAARGPGIPPVSAPPAPAATAPPKAAPAPAASAPYLPVSEEQPPARRKPLYKRWPLWVGVGLVVVGGTVTAAVLASRSRERTIPDGNYLVDFSK